MNDTCRKVDLYILSLALLFLFFIIISFSFPDSSFSIYEIEDWYSLAVKNILALFSFLMLGYCFFAYKRFNFKLKGATEIPFEIKKINSINYEHLTFLATYVVPLISFDFGNSRQIIVLFLLLFIMGVIYIKTDLFYANPSLALLGFHIYQADGDFKMGCRNDIILICHGRLGVGQKVSYIRLDDRIYYVKGA
ncbi:MAG: anti-phage protein KwaA [Paenalcaligenes sp.]